MKRDFPVGYPVPTTCEICSEHPVAFNHQPSEATRKLTPEREKWKRMKKVREREGGRQTTDEYVCDIGILRVVSKALRVLRKMSCVTS